LGVARLFGLRRVSPHPTPPPRKGGGGTNQPEARGGFGVFEKVFMKVDALRLSYNLLLFAILIDVVTKNARESLLHESLRMTW